MKAFDTDTGQRWLFCMTHPDDEISICAWIHRLVQAGVEVHMSWTHSHPVREQEARLSAELLGIPQDRLSFFSATDGSVCDELQTWRPHFQELMDRVAPTRVACGAFEQGHLDHDSTNWLVNQTFSGPVFEIPFYHTYAVRLQAMNRFADPAGQEVIHLTKEEQKLKLAVAKRYRSQNIWQVLWWYEVWQMTRLRPAELRKREIMRLQTHRDFLTPNLPPALAKKVEASDSWGRWRAAINRLNVSR
ncbi:MAG: hypothetical protein BGO01_17970 [Armatimonadetes bacterium 55-13]|nr:PIG-L family deacetylase [Armatimonadota bacterium]OJU64027.1 MAG: hypothetical protein BGO01_17970 [Armatimonadetes bacterium 55-13]